MSELQSHSDRYEERNVVDGYNVVNSASPVGGMSEYLDVMSRPGSWGDQTTLQAAANMLEIPVKIYSSGGHDHTRIISPTSSIHGMAIDAPSDEEPTSQFLSVAHIVESHYDSTRPSSAASFAHGPAPPPSGAQDVGRNELEHGRIEMARDENEDHVQGHVQALRGLIAENLLGSPSKENMRRKVHMSSAPPQKRVSHGTSCDGNADVAKKQRGTGYQAPQWRLVCKFAFVVYRVGGCICTD